MVKNSSIDELLSLCAEYDRPPFSFKFNTLNFPDHLTEFTVLESPPLPVKGGIKQVARYHSMTTGLTVSFEKFRYDQVPIVEWTLYFTNESDCETPVIENIQALDIAMSVSGRQPVLHHFTGSPTLSSDFEPHETPVVFGDAIYIASAAGRPSDINMPYFNIEDGQAGLFFTIGWPGQWATSFERVHHLENESILITAGQKKTHFKILPGECLRSPRIVLMAYQNGFINSQNVWRRWMREYNQPDFIWQRMKPQISACNGNYYEGLRTDAATELLFLRNYIRHDIRIDFWWQDAGWYPCEKSWWESGIWWECDPSRFPDGIREVSDYCHMNGMRTIVWFEPERVHPGTWLYENKPEWIMKTAENETGLLRIGNPECRKWIADKIGTFMKAQGIDIYRQDFNISPGAYWEHEDTPDRQGVAEIQHITGYLAFWDDLLEKNPGMYIDTCASGGKRLDVETLKRSVPLLRSDFTFNPESNQSQTYGLSFLIPYQGTGFLDIDEYGVRSLMLPELTLGADTRRDDIDDGLLRRLVDEWTKISDLMLQGDYYPLTGFSLLDTAWMAWQFMVPETGEGFVQVFRRANCLQDTAVHRLHGLDDQSTYCVENFDGGVQEIIGKTLMDEGLAVTIQTAPKALIFTIKKKP